MIGMNGNCGELAFHRSPVDLDIVNVFEFVVKVLIVRQKAQVLKYSHAQTAHVQMKFIWTDEKDNGAIGEFFKSILQN